MENKTVDLNSLSGTSLKVLEKKLYLLLDKYIIPNNDICEYAIIHKNIPKLKNYSQKDLEQFIVRNYPQILLINRHLDSELVRSYKYKDITDDRIFLDDQFYSNIELSNLILNHNKNLVIPKPNQYLSEKEKLIDWFSYNTPIVRDPTITPMTGLVLGQDLRVAKVKYIEWIITSAYLLKEFNIWNKAKYYSENKNSVFSIEFKQAYYYFIKTI